MFAKIYLRLLTCIFSVDVYCLCITLWTSREIIIETLNFPKSKMRDTTGDQLSIIWFVLLCAKCSSVMFDIIGKLRFWINTILTSIDFSEHIQVYKLYKFVMTKKRRGKVGNLLKKYLRSFPYSSCLLTNANWLRNSFYQMKNNRLFTHYANGKCNRCIPNGFCINGRRSFRETSWSIGEPSHSQIYR